MELMSWIARASLCAAVSACAVGQQEVKDVEQDKPASAKANLLLWGEEARTHVSSTRIVRGIVHVDMDSLHAAVKNAGHVNLRIDVQENIYGAASTPAKFRAFVPKTGVPSKNWEWSSKDIAAWHGQDRIVFLTTSGGTYYLASDVAAIAVVEASRYAIIRVRHRETLHRNLLAEPLRQDRKRQQAIEKLMRRMCGGKEMQHENVFGSRRCGSRRGRRDRCGDGCASQTTRPRDHAAQQGEGPV